MTKEWERAVRRGDVESLHLLVQQGGDINSKDRYGQTSLMIASMLGLANVVQYLIDQGAELDHTAKYQLTALMLAVINGHTEIARSLAEAGADQTVQGAGAPGFHGMTAMDLAQRQNRPDLVEALGGEKERER